MAFSEARTRMARTAGVQLGMELIEATVGDRPIWDGFAYRFVESGSDALAAARSRITAAAARQGEADVADAYTEAAIVGLNMELRYFARCMAIAPFPNQWRRYAGVKSTA